MKRILEKYAILQEKILRNGRIDHEDVKALFHFFKQNPIGMTGPVKNRLWEIKENCKQFNNEDANLEIKGKIIEIGRILRFHSTVETLLGFAIPLAFIILLYVTVI